MDSHASSPIAAYLRTHKDAITTAWEQDVVSRFEPLRRMSRPALIDHMPEVIEAVAAWVEGREHDGREGFRLLADGHALQRLGHGVDVRTLAGEYSRLRHVVLRHVLAVPLSDVVREEIIRCNDALDVAINDALLIYGERQSAIRERFIAILAHDLRAPLQSVRLSADALLQLETPGERATVIGARIVRGAERMKRIIDSVLEFARGQLGGGIPAVPTSTDMGELCRLAADELRASHPDLVVTVDLRGDLRGVWDGDRVHQALTNLLVNAAHHGGGGAVTIAAWEGDDRQRVHTSITNRGPVIPEDELPVLFEPFYRGQRSRAGGLGLGLAIVRMIAAAHGARVTVTSTAEAGTTFTIEWPRTPLDETPSRPLA